MLLLELAYRTRPVEDVLFQLAEMVVSDAK